MHGSFFGLTYCMSCDAKARVVSLLEPGFRRYLPFMNAWWVVAFVLNVIVLREGRWRRATRCCEILLDGFGAAICAAIVLGPPVFRYDQYVKLGLWVVLAVTIVRGGVRAYRLRRSGPRREPWEAASAR